MRWPYTEHYPYFSSLPSLTVERSAVNKKITLKDTNKINKLALLWDVFVAKSLTLALASKWTANF